MKLLIISPGPLYPIQGMSQVRIINQIKFLAREHEVTLIDIISKEENSIQCISKLSRYLKTYQSVHAQTYRMPKLIRIIRHIIIHMTWLMSFYSKEELSDKAAGIPHKLMNIMNQQKFDAVILHYWYLGSVFRKLPKEMYKIIDTHYLVQENIDLLNQYKLSGFMRWRLKHELMHCLRQQNLYFRMSNLVLVNSARQLDLLQEKSPELKVILAVNGQDISEYLNYDFELEDNTILFYGALNNQFNRIGLLVLLQEIYPELKRQVPELRLYIVGSNPPRDLMEKYADSDIIFKGFVDDIRPVVSKCCLMLLPLFTSSGFRGRAVEVMSLGVPIIGTFNALQSLGIADGVEGFISDDIKCLIGRSIEVLNNKELRYQMSVAGRNFARENFSLEAAYDILSETLKRVASGE